MPTSQSSTLLTLPPELRLQVYDLLFEHYYSRIDEVYHVVIPAILHVCRDLRSECYPLTVALVQEAADLVTEIYEEDGRAFGKQSSHTLHTVTIRSICRRHLRDLTKLAAVLEMHASGTE